MSEGSTHTPTADAEFLRQTVAIFRSQKELTEKSLAQLSDAELFFQPSEESNSIAVIMKHLAGNMISRWTDFLSSDGEKANRNRDAEFEVQKNTVAELKEYWQRGWAVLFATLDSLSTNDLHKTITIRNEEHSVIQALIRQISHYAYHTGQIVYLAKMIRNHEWTTLSIPRGQSALYSTTPPPTTLHITNKKG